jgi:hypothetical protein
MTESSRVIIPTFDNKRDPRAFATQIGIVAVILIILIGFVGYLIISAPPSNAQRVVSFRIEGSGGTARMTYTETDGHQTDPTFVSIPWESGGKYYKSGTQVFLTAGSTSATGTISCVLKLDGQEWKREASTGTDGKVACGGIVP